MSKVKTGDKVKVHYTLSVEENIMQESKKMGEPNSFIVGEGTMLPGFEKNIEGLKVGDTKTFTLPYAVAYGKRVEDAIIKIPRVAFPPDFKLVMDDIIQGETKGGRPTLGRIIAMDKKEVTLDMNHPLAGKDVTFDVELIELEKKSTNL